MTDRGAVLEIFCSYQGEGPYAGVKQVFLRLSGCHLRCAYCDTPESWERSGTCSIEEKPMSASFVSEENPLTKDRVLALLNERIESWKPHSVSITGGEPLLQAPFLAKLLPEISVPTYLDTSGTLSDRLETVIDHVDIVALDLKLPSCPGVKADPDDARRCVELADRKEAFVKIVVLKDSRTDEVEDAARIIAGVNPDIPLILQPVTEGYGDCTAPEGAEIRSFRGAAEKHLRDVTVLPQLHPIAGWK